MSKMRNDDNELRPYLLGQLSEDEEADIDDRLLIDDAYFQRLEIVEEELIDDYVCGVLSESEQKALTVRFLATPEGKKKLNFAVAMHNQTADRSGSERTHEENLCSFYGSSLKGLDKDAHGSSQAGSSFERGSTPLPLTYDVSMQGEHEAVYAKETTARDKASIAYDSKAGTRTMFSSLSAPSFKLVASVLLVAVVGVVAYRLFFYKTDLDNGMKLLHDLHSARRPLESRIAALSYASAPSAHRAGTDKPTIEYQAKHDRIELLLGRSLSEYPGPDAKHAIGVFLLTDKRFDDAIPYLQDAVNAQLSNAKFHNDLGVALLEKSKQRDHGTQSGSSENTWENVLVRGLAEFDIALKLKPSLLEALFNRALCYEEMKDFPNAKRDWEIYLKQDPDSSWTAEAAEKLKSLESGSR